MGILWARMGTIEYMGLIRLSRSRSQLARTSAHNGIPSQLLQPRKQAPIDCRVQLVQRLIIITNNSFTNMHMCLLTKHLSVAC